MSVIMSILLGTGLVSIFFLRYSRVFGKKPSKEKAAAFKASKNFSHNKFVNQIPTIRGINAGNFFGTAREFIKGNPQGRPNRPLPVEVLHINRKQDAKEATVTWFGHSTVLLEIEGQRILLDPVFANRPSPFPLFGGKRYSQPIRVEDLPPIDAVMLSHDHYDHLDYGSIMKLKDKVGIFYVPLGVVSHLTSWGINEEKIREHDWWDESQWNGLQLACVPTRHFSGRGLSDRDSTLWCSWVIIGQQTKIYFSGDGGYGPHFKEIGSKYGPFDVALMECGQYDRRWSAIHMVPEETVQAHMDVQGKLMIPIHWAAFSLALHDWTDPIERVIKAGKEKGIQISTPKIGETVRIDGGEYPTCSWWR